MDIQIAPEKKRREKRKEIDTDEVAEVIVPRRRVNAKKFKNIQGQVSTYDDKTPVPNIMDMTPEERKAYIQTAPNPFGYPARYWDIYTREKERRNLRGFENLLDITSTRVFTDDTDQIPSRLQIRNHRNVNCIKSKEEFNNSLLESIQFNNDVHIYFRSQGVHYVGEEEDYIEMRMNSDQDYRNAHDDAINQFYVEKYGKPRSELSYSEMTHHDYSDEVQISDDITRHFKDNVWLPEYRAIYNSRNADIYDCVIAALRYILGDLYQYVSVAGGFALSMYVFKNYGYHIGCKDIDMFIHSCSDEVKNEILIRLNSGFGDSSYNDNVVCINLGSMEYDGYRSPIFTTTGMHNIQVIRRLYSCPQEVITGFDVDCCCILTTLDGRIWITERGHYSLVNGYNTLNFERMSPSYEYRLLKYRFRGFAIWIPFIEYFRDNAILHFPSMKKIHGSTIFLRSLEKFFDDSTIDKKSSEDYMKGHFSRYNPDEPIEFKVLNPGEQTINTFHRIFLDDPKVWYPVKPEGTLDNFNLNLSGDVPIEISTMIPITPIIARNIVKKYLRDKDIKRVSPFAAKVCYSLLQFLYQLDNTITVYDDLPNGVVFGLPTYIVKIENKSTLNKPRIEFLYKLYTQLTKYSSLVKRLMGIDFPLNGLESLMACKYVYCDYDDEGNAIRSNIDILDESSYDFLRSKRILGLFSLDEYEKHVVLHSKINIRVIQPTVIQPPVGFGQASYGHISSSSPGQFGRAPLPSFSQTPVPHFGYGQLPLYPQSGLPPLYQPSGSVPKPLYQPGGSVPNPLYQPFGFGITMVPDSPTHNMSPGIPQPGGFINNFTMADSPQSIQSFMPQPMSQSPQSPQSPQFPGQQYPGQSQPQFPGQQYPGQSQPQFPGQSQPQFPGQQYPGQYPPQFPGQQYPGQYPPQFPGQQYPQQFQPQSPQSQIRMQKEAQCGIEIVLPAEFTQMHEMLLRCLMYQSYSIRNKNQITKTKWTLFKTIPVEDRDRIGKEKSIAVSLEEAQARHPLQSFEEFVHNNPIIDESVIFSNDSNILYVTNNGGRLNSEFQFRDGKIYGTEYNIAKTRFNLQNDRILEYPAIDNFIPK